LLRLLDTFSAAIFQKARWCSPQYNVSIALNLGKRCWIAGFVAARREQRVSPAVAGDAQDLSASFDFGISR
jgi:hypothetical protein